MVIVLSDFMDPAGYQRPLGLLTGGDRDVFALQILAPEETNPQLAGDLRLVDSETSLAIDLSISDRLLHKYQLILRGYIQQLHDWCLKHDIFYLYTATDQSFEDLVLKYLRRIGMLR